MNISTIQSWVREWHFATFGEISSRRIIRKVDEEVAEFHDAAQAQCDGARNNAGEEAADVVLSIMAFCGREGIDLEAEVLKKLEINKQRKWACVNGHWVRTK